MGAWRQRGRRPGPRGRLPRAPPGARVALRSADPHQPAAALRGDLHRQPHARRHGQDARRRVRGAHARPARRAPGRRQPRLRSPLDGGPGRRRRPLGPPRAAGRGGRALPTRAAAPRGAGGRRGQPVRGGAPGPAPLRRVGGRPRRRLPSDARGARRGPCGLRGVPRPLLVWARGSGPARRARRRRGRGGARDDGEGLGPAEQPAPVAAAPLGPRRPLRAARRRRPLARSARPPAQMNVLVRLPNWLGDTVMALPLLRSLRAGLAPSDRTVAIGPWAWLVAGQELADRWVGYPRAWTGRLRALEAVRPFCPDVALLLPNSLESALTPRYWRARRRIGYDTSGRGIWLTDRLPLPWPRRHQIDEYLGLLAPLGLAPAGAEPP